MPDFFRQSGDDVSNAEQFALLGLACLKHVHIGLIGWVVHCLEALVLDGLLVLGSFLSPRSAMTR